VIKFIKTINNKNKILLIIVLFIIAIIFFLYFYVFYNSPKIDINGLWKNNENSSILKIIQNENEVTSTLYELDSNWKWSGEIGDVTVRAKIDGNEIVGKILIVPAKGQCEGYKWWHDYSAKVSDDGKTIEQVFQTNVYDLNTCKETGEYPLKTKTLTKIQ